MRVTPFAHADYEQTQRVNMTGDAGLVLLDWLTAGRVEGGEGGHAEGVEGSRGEGERWAFARYRSHTEVRIDGECVLADGLWLDPAHGPLTGEHRMGRFNAFASVLILGDPLRDDARPASRGGRRRAPAPPGPTSSPPPARTRTERCSARRG